MALNLVTASANFTRPADTTQYSVGDLVANHATAGSVVSMSFALTANASGILRINRVLLYKSTTSITSADFRLHLYTAAPTVTNGDNGAFVSSQHATYLGSIDVTAGLAFAAAAAGWGAAAINANLVTANTLALTLRGLLEARATYTPGNAEVFTLTIEGEAY